VLCALLLSLCAAGGAATEKHLVLIALDEASYRDAINFGGNVLAAATSISIAIYVQHGLEPESPAFPHRMAYYHATPLADSAVSRRNKTVEKASAILEVLVAETRVLSRARRRRNLVELRGSAAAAAATATTVMYSIAFREGSLPIPTHDFAAAFDLFAGPEAPDLMLLEKNAHLRSVSDWHDLLVLGLRLHSGTRQWLRDAHAVYLRHADRPQFPLLEPRVALREASVRHPRLAVQYFKQHEVCVSQGTNAEEEAQYRLRYGIHSECSEGAKDAHHNRTLLTLRCSGADLHVRESACAVLHEPLRWRKDINIEVPRTWAEHAGYAPERILVNPLVSMSAGVLRFRAEYNAHAAERVAAAKGGQQPFPRQFCWNSEGIIEEHAKSRIFYSTTNSSEYVHPTAKVEEAGGGGVQGPFVELLSATGATAKALDDAKYLAIAKMYYCKRHGYSYKQMLSDQYVQFFPPNFYETCANERFRPDSNRASTKRPYQQQVMSKPVMVAEAMLEQALAVPEASEAWMVWTDDDVYINPGWLYLPLHETYLKDIPKNKLYVVSNYRSAFTNVVAIRNSVEGRALVYDWLAVMLSGKVECHGYDQAAMQILILLRLFSDSHAPLLAKPLSAGPRSMTVHSSRPSTVKVDDITPSSGVYKYPSATPFNYTCLYSEDGADGCNAGAVWSCDFRFEKALSEAGFTTIPQPFFHNHIISSYSKGCANEFVPDFHVVTETATRPRLQCGLCSRLDEIITVHHWDGPLGGGNDKLFRGAINGWFFNHKSRSLFWKAYLNSGACLRMAESEFVPECDALETELHHDALYRFSNEEYTTMSADKKHHVDSRREALHGHGHNLVSLTDGYAFDIRARSYCRVSLRSMLDHQKAATYMRDYDSLISRANDGYTEAQWWDRYDHMRADESRMVCGRDDTSENVADSVLFAALNAEPPPAPGSPYSDFEHTRDSHPIKVLKHCQQGRRSDNMPAVALTALFDSYLPADKDIFEVHDFCGRCSVRPAEWKSSNVSRFAVDCRL